MAIYDTTEYNNATMLHKSRLTKNFATDNYWIESYQNKVDQAWRFATDVVDVLEQSMIYNEEGYMLANPYYHPLEVRITTAYDEKGVKLSDDYRNIIYRNMEHEVRLGRKYCFDQNHFGDLCSPTVSTWLTINLNSVAVGPNCIIRRCTQNLGFLINNHTLEHYEPAILDYDPKYTINYFQEVLNTVKSEVYATLQFNEYTKDIAVNDRFILGALNFSDTEKNTAYKVKEVFRLGSLTTDNPNDVPLLMLALDRDLVNPDYDYIAKDEDGTLHYIADYYNTKRDSGKNPDPVPKDHNYIDLSPAIDILRVGQEIDLICTIKNGDEVISTDLDIEVTLPGPYKPELYYEATIDTNRIHLKCLKQYYRNNLQIIVHAPESFNIPDLQYELTLSERV